LAPPGKAGEGLQRTRLEAGQQFVQSIFEFPGQDEIQLWGVLEQLGALVR
jgi:hypothetical protein